MVVVMVMMTVGESAMKPRSITSYYCDVSPHPLLDHF